jgi:CheY-like chemotaxis protein
VGTGLGLSLVAEIVRAHGGSIRVGSSPRGGARFELRFPLAREASPPRRSTPPTLPGPDRRMRLLLIDDEPTILRLFSTLLAERFDVTTCGEGAAAIKLLERDRAFDVILCDLQMPRTDGIHVHEAVQRLEPALLGRFVFTTGGAVTQRGRDFLDHQAPRLLPKPFSINDLYAAIAEMSGDGTE